MPDNLIQEVKAIIAEHKQLIAVTQADGPGSAGGYLMLSNFEEDAGRKALDLLPALVDLVERSQAQAIEELAARIAYENNMQLCECREYALCYARRELALAAPSWKRIGPEEQAAIHRAIRGMEDPNWHHSHVEKEAVEVLKRLVNQ